MAGRGAGGVLFIALLGLSALIYRQRHTPPLPTPDLESMRNLPASSGKTSPSATARTPMTPTPLHPIPKSDERSAPKTKRNGAGVGTPSPLQEPTKPAKDG